MTTRIGNHLYGEKVYYRVKARCRYTYANGTTKTKDVYFWAKDKWKRQGGSIGYQMCGKDGEVKYIKDVRQCELVVAHPDDIIYEKKARMNLHYGELEVI